MAMEDHRERVRYWWHRNLDAYPETTLEAVLGLLKEQTYEGLHGDLLDLLDDCAIPAVDGGR
jgi:hypothetical protein